MNVTLFLSLRLGLCFRILLNLLAWLCFVERRIDSSIFRIVYQVRYPFSFSYLLSGILILIFQMFSCSALSTQKILQSFVLSFSLRKRFRIDFIIHGHCIGAIHQTWHLLMKLTSYSDVLCREHPVNFTTSEFVLPSGPVSQAGM